jgi:hypothetical protein
MVRQFLLGTIILVVALACWSTVLASLGLEGGEFAPVATLSAPVGQTTTGLPNESRVMLCFSILGVTAILMAVVYIVQRARE